MGTVSRYGRDFSFDDDVSEAVQNERIKNWMQQHAASELESETPPEAKHAESKSDPRLAKIATLLMMATPAAPLMMTPQGQQRVGDVNFYRTLAQGALPFADEAEAGVRSLLGEKYDDVLKEAREGVKAYEDKVG